MLLQRVDLSDGWSDGSLRKRLETARGFVISPTATGFYSHLSSWSPWRLQLLADEDAGVPVGVSGPAGPMGLASKQQGLSAEGEQTESALLLLTVAPGDGDQSLLCTVAIVPHQRPSVIPVPSFIGYARSATEYGGASTSSDDARLAVLSLELCGRSDEERAEAVCLRSTLAQALHLHLWALS